MPDAFFDAFEAHYVPDAARMLGLEHAVEEAIERFSPLRSVLAYNYAVASQLAGAV